MDHSRGIAGELNAGYPVPLEQRSFINLVMREYDANRYRMSMDAMQIRLDTRVKPLPWRL